MLNKFTYQLELNNLEQCTTKSSIKAKIVKHNRQSFDITTATKITFVLPFYNNPDRAELVESRLLNYNLLQLAITKYAELYDITELPIYAQFMHKFKINFTLKE